MDDNYFDERLKGILENSPTQEADTAAVADMQRRLRGEERPRPTPWFYKSWVLGMTGLFVAVAAFWYLQTQFNQRLIALEQRFSQQLTTTQEQNSQVIYHTDTIYQIVQRQESNIPLYNKTVTSATQALWSGNRRPLSAALQQTNSNSYLQSQNQTLTHTNSVFNWSLSRPFYNLLRPSSSSGFITYVQQKNEGSSTSASTEPALIPLNAPLIAHREFRYFHIPLFDQLDGTAYLTDAELTKPKPLRFLHPTGFEFGLNLDPYLLLNTNPSSTAFVLGLSGRLHFQGNRAITFGAEQLDLTFETSTLDESTAGFPFVAPDDPDDDFSELYGFFDYWQFPVQLRQYFSNGNKFTPFINAGIVIDGPREREFKYKYRGDDEDYDRRIRDRQNDISINQIRLGLGFNYQLGQHFSLESELIYQLPIKQSTEEFDQLKYGSLQLGLNYRL